MAVELEMGVALRRGDAVVKKRGFCGRRRETGGIWWALREAARRHDRHIIFFSNLLGEAVCGVG